MIISRLTEQANIFFNAYIRYQSFVIFLCSLSFLALGASNTSPLQLLNGSAMWKNLYYHFQCIFPWHLLAVNSKFMAHSAVWGHPPILRLSTNSKMLMTEKFSKSGLRRCIKFGQAHSNDEPKITLSLILHFILDLWI